MQNVYPLHSQAAEKRPFAPVLTGILLLLMGAGLGAAGGLLVSLQGSWYYAIAGTAMALTGVLLIAKQPAALWLFALVVAGTLAWALWESGLDWWPFAARGDVIFLIGLFLLTPWVTRPLADRNQSGDRRTRPGEKASPTSVRGGKLALGLALGLFLLAAAASWFTDPYKLEGTLAQRAVAAPGAGNSASTATSPTSATSPTPANNANNATASAVVLGETGPGGTPDGDWHAYGRTGYGQRYSPLAQITPANVKDLRVAWQYQTGDVRGKPGDPTETTFEVTPLKVGNRLFFCTPHQFVIALDATTGAELWRYNPKIEGELALQHLTCRGLSYQAAGASTPPAASQQPAAASPTAAVPSSATPPGAAGKSPQARSAAQVKGTAPAKGAATAQLPSKKVAVGDKIDSLKPASSRPTLPVAAVTSNTGTSANCLAKLFMPTADGRLIALNPDNGSVCTSFGGGKGQIDLWANMPNVRPGAYYSTSPVVVARGLVVVGGYVLDNVSTHEQSGVIRAFNANTGALVWNWDSGNPDQSAPLSPGQTYTVNSPNSWSISSVDEALGMVYVPMGNQPPDQWGGNRSPSVEKYSSSVVALDLATGKVRWSFQTVHHDLWDYDVPAQPSLVNLTVNGVTVPALVQPTKQGELFVLDRRSGKPLLPVTEMPAPQGAAKGDHTAPAQPLSGLSFNPPPLAGKDMWGATMFDQLACRIAFHRLRYDGRFTPPSTQGSLIYPGNFGVFNWGGVAVDPLNQTVFSTPAYLAFVSKLIPRSDDTSMLVQGKKPPQGALPALNENFGAPFAIKLSPFTSVFGVPCQQPPWGYVAGSDLRTGKTVWMHKNGTVRDLSPVPLPFKMGVPSLGGPILTAGGLAFVSGTLDYYVRGYNASTGGQIWESRLPAGGQATPMTYLGTDGRQFLVVIAGGHGSLGTKAGDYVIAYALPRREGEQP